MAIEETAIFSMFWMLYEMIFPLIMGGEGQFRSRKDRKRTEKREEKK
jgi:hypothetical protein